MPRKGDPGYDEWKQKLSEAAKERMSDPEKRQKFLENGKKSQFSKGQEPTNKGKPMSESQLVKMRALRPSAESIAKMRATKRGRKLSKEHKTKIGESLKGRPVSPETRAKIGDSQRGRKHSSERIAKMAASKRGKPSGRKGIKHTLEARAKMSVSLKGRTLSAEARAKMKAHTSTKEFRSKMSESNRIRWQKKTDDEKRTHLDKLHAGGLNITNSSIEEAYALRLDSQGIIYERQKRIGWYRVDFYIDSENKIVEVNGCYWHDCEQCGHANKHPGKREKDIKRYEYLRRKGYTVEVIWEHDIHRKR